MTEHRLPVWVLLLPGRVSLRDAAPVALGHRIRAVQRGPHAAAAALALTALALRVNLCQRVHLKTASSRVKGLAQASPCQFSAAFHMELYDAPDPARQLSANGNRMPALSEGCSGAAREAALTKLSEASRIEGCKSPSACSRRASSDVDVAEAQEVCCGVRGEQAKACQTLLNKGKALDSKCKQLSCR